MNITILIYRKTFCAKKNEPIGELIVDLTTVWNQPNHCFYKKWGQLENPFGINDPIDIQRGHIQLDLSIISKYEKPAPAVLHVKDYDEIET